MIRSVTKWGAAPALLAVVMALFAVGTLFADDDNNKKGNNSGDDAYECTNNCADKPGGSSDQNRTSGEVLAINTLVDPNEIILGNVDGRVTVKMYGKDAAFLIKSSGIKVKDYIEVVGYKENDNLFWADTISARDDNH